MTNVQQPMIKEWHRAVLDAVDGSEETDHLSLELEFWGLDLEANGLGSALVLKDEPCPAERRFDLMERTSRFGESVIRFCQRIPRNPTGDTLARQLVRSGTSVGANYCEADDAVSKKEFKHKIGICRKEAKETKYWLRMVALAEPGMKPDARELWKEAREPHLIFCTIYNRS